MKKHTKTPIQYEGKKGFICRYFHKLSVDSKLQSSFLQSLKPADSKLKRICEEEMFKKIYLFPNFGKKFGLGEPDVVISTTGNKILFIEVETMVYPRSCYELMRRMAVAFDGHFSTSTVLDMVSKYRKTPLYQMERFYMLGSGLVKHEKEGSDNKEEFYSVLPFSDQFSKENANIRDFMPRGSKTLQNMAKEISVADDFYVVLFLVAGKPMSNISYLYDALNLMQKIWSRYPSMWDEINYSGPSTMSSKDRECIIRKAVDTEFKVSRFKTVIYRGGSKLLWLENTIGIKFYCLEPMPGEVN